MLNRDTIPSWITETWSGDDGGPGKAQRMRAERRKPPAGDAAGAGRPAKPRRDGARSRFTRAFWPLGAAARRALGGPRLRPAGDPDPPPVPRTSPRRRRVLLLALLVLGVRRFRWPTEAARAGAHRRDAARAARSPRCATRRRSAATTPGAQAVWAAHLARMRRPRRRRRPVARRPPPRGARPLGAPAVALVPSSPRRSSPATAHRGGGRRAAARAGRRGRHRPELRGLGRAAGLHRPPDALPPRGRRAAAACRSPRAPRSPCAPMARPDRFSSPRPSRARRPPGSPRRRRASPRRSFRSRPAAR